MFQERRFVDVILPKNSFRVILDAPHAASPKREYYTGAIVSGVALRCGVGGVISRVSRMIADLNRGIDYSPELGTQDLQRKAIKEHFKSMEDILRHISCIDGGRVTQPVLLVAVHGVKDENAERHSCDVIVGTCHLGVCSEEVRDWLVDMFSSLLEKQKVPSRVKCEVPEYSGHPSLIEFRNIFGEKFNVIQLELSKKLRTEFREEVIESLLIICKSFGKYF
ncbi:MAG: hypothetical protein ABGX27_05535 [Desulfurobacteriaceae bacterium]